MAAVTAARMRSVPRSYVKANALEDQAVTIRERDFAMNQERVALDQVKSYLAARLAAKTFITWSGG